MGVPLPLATFITKKCNFPSLPVNENRFFQFQTTADSIQFCFNLRTFPYCCLLERGKLIEGVLVRGSTVYWIAFILLYNLYNIQMFCLLLVLVQSLSRCVPGIGMYFCTLHGLTQSFGR